MQTMGENTQETRHGVLKTGKEIDLDLDRKPEKMPEY